MMQVWQYEHGSDPNQNQRCAENDGDAQQRTLKAGEWQSRGDHNNHLQSTYSRSDTKAVRRITLPCDPWVAATVAWAHVCPTIHLSRSRDAA